MLQYVLKCVLQCVAVCCAKRHLFVGRALHHHNREVVVGRDFNDLAVVFDHANIHVCTFVVLGSAEGERKRGRGSEGM